MSYGSMYIGQCTFSALNSATRSSRSPSTNREEKKVDDIAQGIFKKFISLTSSFKSSAGSLRSKISESFHSAASTISSVFSSKPKTPTQAETPKTPLSAEERRQNRKNRLKTPVNYTGLVSSGKNMEQFAPPNASKSSS